MNWSEFRHRVGVARRLRQKWRERKVLRRNLLALHLICTTGSSETWGFEGKRSGRQ